MPVEGGGGASTASVTGTDGGAWCAASIAGAPGSEVLPALELKMVAIKVIKNKESFRKQAQMELELLELLNRKDTTDQVC